LDLSEICVSAASKNEWKNERMRLIERKSLLAEKKVTPQEAAAAATTKSYTETGTRLWQEGMMMKEAQGRKRKAKRKL